MIPDDDIHARQKGEECTRRHSFPGALVTPPAVTRPTTSVARIAYVPCSNERCAARLGLRHSGLIGNQHRDDRPMKSCRRDVSAYISTQQRILPRGQAR